MPWPRARFSLILVLVSLALLSTAAPSWAHTDDGASLSTNAATARGSEVPPASDGALRQLTRSAAPETPGLPGLALLGALIAVALGLRRPRRTLVFALVLLLAIFAFEVGRHSVHHLGAQSQLNTCAVAVAAAHLTATAADEGGAVEVILPALAIVTEVSQTDPVTRLLSPVQGRAPPPTAG